MKRKQIVKLGQADDMSVADSLLVCAQTILVISVLMREVDPNEAYNEWVANLHSLLTASEVLQTVAKQYAVELSDLKVELPPHIVLGGYRVEEINKKLDDDFPF